MYTDSIHFDGSDMVSIEKLLGCRIQKIRMSKKITQEELAARIEKSPHFISDIERGIKGPSIQTLTDIIRGLETTPNEVFCDIVDVEDRAITDLMMFFSTMTKEEKEFIIKVTRAYQEVAGK